MNIKDKLTIVIPSYNELNYIDATITSIAAQNGIWGTKVIIADAKSTDGTVELIKSLKTYYEPTIDIELIKGGKVAYGRNQGGMRCKTPYILFMDADSTLKNPNQIKETLGQMENEGLDLLTCNVSCTVDDWKCKTIFKIFNRINHIMKRRVPFALGTYFLTTRRAFLDNDGFDETLQHSEDYHLSKKYNPKKFRISKHYVGQDNRRFLKMGYFGMIRLVLSNYFNRHNIEHFKKDVGYW
jgi:glycosyltransferase involved in cell wall biosynthesis